MLRVPVFVLPLLLLACKPQEPPHGFGVPEAVVTEEGEKWVDLDDDGLVDVPLGELCPEVVLEEPQIWRQASGPLADAIGFDRGYEFRLRASGQVGICRNGWPDTKPIWWACSDGDIDVFLGGAVGTLYGGENGWVATVTVGERLLGGEEGWLVEVLGVKDGEWVSGMVYDAPEACP